MSKETKRKFHLKESEDGSIVYSNDEIDIEDFVRMAIEYEVLLNENKRLEKRIDGSLTWAREMAAKQKEMDRKIVDLQNKFNSFTKQEKLF